MSKKLDRRNFIKIGSTAIAIGTGISLTTFAKNNTAVNNDKRWGMLVDTTKCIDGCDDCVNACKKENGWGNEKKSNKYQQANWIRKVTIKDKATGKIDNLPLMCQHCAQPPCVDVCPTGASMKREDGIVLVDRHICIGCRYCMMACPYDARSFVHEDITEQKEHMPRGKGTVESCTMCVHKIDNNEQPACVDSCTSGALLFGDLYDNNSEISQRLKKVQSDQIRADLNLNTAIRYSGI